MTTFFIGDIESIGAVMIGQTKRINKVGIRPFLNAERESAEWETSVALPRVQVLTSSPARASPGLVHGPVG
jgi:hypothetical protein